MDSCVIRSWRPIERVSDRWSPLWYAGMCQWDFIATRKEQMPTWKGTSTMHVRYVIASLSRALDFLSRKKSDVTHIPRTTCQVEGIREVTFLNLVITGKMC